jgi:hypothetical protein
MLESSSHFNTSCDICLSANLISSNKTDMLVLEAKRRLQGKTLVWGFL